MSSEDLKDHIIVSPGLAIPTALLDATNISSSDIEEFSNMSVSFSTTSEAPLHETGKMCENLDGFKESYNSVHGYICLVICIFGAVANLLNIIVLTRKEMNGSPINRILTGMAVADITLIIEYLPFLIHNNLWVSSDESVQFSRGWAAYMWFHSNFSVVIHNVSIWLTLTIAVWRFIMIKYHTLVPVYCTMERCHFVLLSAYVGPVILTIPMFFTFTIDEYSVTKNVTLFSEPVGNSTLFWPNPDNATWTSTISITKYFVNFSSLAQAQEQLLFRLTIWLYSFILKFIPSIVLTIFTGFLIHALYKAEERSARLKNGRSTSANQSAPKREENQQERGVQTSNNLRVAVNNNGNVEAGVASNQPQPSRRRSTIHGKSSRKKSTDRTTRLLIVILVLFLLTEFPQAILGMLSAIKLEFFHACYMPLGDLMDDIALLNSSINFVIYYFMSRQFRKNFLQTFGLTWCQNCTQDNAAANQLLKKDEHEMRPLMGPKSQGQPLVPRRPQIIIGDHQTAMVESLPDSPQVMQVTEKSANYVLKRTNEPSQQI